HCATIRHRAPVAGRVIFIGHDSPTRQSYSDQPPETVVRVVSFIVERHDGSAPSGLVVGVIKARLHSPVWGAMHDTQHLSGRVVLVCGHGPVSARFPDKTASCIVLVSNGSLS